MKWEQCSYGQSLHGPATIDSAIEETSHTSLELLLAVCPLTDAAEQRGHRWKHKHKDSDPFPSREARFDNYWSASFFGYLTVNTFTLLKMKKVVLLKCLTHTDIHRPRMSFGTGVSIAGNGHILGKKATKVL